jgi:putative sugar O-methyltransferase
MEHPFWAEYRKRIAADHKNLPIDDFKNWPSVRQLPLYNPDELKAEYAADNKKLLMDSIRKSEWIDVLSSGEPKLGYGTKESWKSVHFTFEDFRTSAWCMKTLHHILTFEKLRGFPITDYQNIVEIGAGIGETARMIFDQHYTGKYYVIDFPEVSKISSYYLDNRTIPLDNIDQLPYNVKDGLFIATWSLSETPLEYRDKIAERIRGFDQLLLFQRQFKEISNPKYFFEQWPFKSNIFYRIQDLGFHRGDGGNMYMIGKGNKRD